MVVDCWYGIFLKDTGSYQLLAVFFKQPKEIHQGVKELVS